MNPIRYRVIYYNSDGTTSIGEEFTKDPVIERTGHCPCDMNQLNVRDNTYIKIYDREKYTSMTWIGKFGHVYIGDYQDIDYNRLDYEVQLWIRDGWYDYDYILDHYSEIVEELENIHLEKTLQEL